MHCGLTADVLHVVAGDAQTNDCCLKIYGCVVKMHLYRPIYIIQYALQFCMSVCVCVYVLCMYVYMYVCMFV